MTDDQHDHHDRHARHDHVPGTHGSWQPTASGEYELDGTAFVQLPDELIDGYQGTDESGRPLAAPGHGYVPPPIDVSQSPDPSAGGWGVQGTGDDDGSYGAPYEGASYGVPGMQPGAVHWPDANGLPPQDAHQHPGGPGGHQPSQDLYGYDPGTPQMPGNPAGDTFGSGGPWHFDDDLAQGAQSAQGQAHAPQAPVQPSQSAADGPGGAGGVSGAAGGREAAGHPESDSGAGTGSGVAGEWSIPLARGDLPDASGEFTTAVLAEQWGGGTPPSTLPGGATAPWATGTSTGSWDDSVVGSGRDIHPSSEFTQQEQQEYEQQQPGQESYGQQEYEQQEYEQQEYEQYGADRQPYADAYQGDGDAYRGDDYTARDGYPEQGEYADRGRGGYAGHPEQREQYEQHEQHVQRDREDTEGQPVVRPYMDAMGAIDASGIQDTADPAAPTATPSQQNTPKRPSRPRRPLQDTRAQEPEPLSEGPSELTAEQFPPPPERPSEITTELYPPGGPDPDGASADAVPTDGATGPVAGEPSPHGDPEADAAAVHHPDTPRPPGDPADDGMPDTDTPDAPTATDPADAPDISAAPGEPTGAAPADTPLAPDVPDVSDVPVTAETPAAPDGTPAASGNTAEDGTPEGAAADEGTTEEEATEEDAAEADAAFADEHPLASYVLRVNGSDRPVTGAWIGESLLYVLRERLGLAGAKDGCSQGECGACNVQVDGRLVASCLVPAVTTAGSEVRTVEGLARDGQPSDVQRALADCGAVQCGFCVPGMAMTVHDLLEGNPRPTPLEARRALSGNLCRCSAYRGVLDAVDQVAAERRATAESEAAHSAHDAHQGDPSHGGRGLRIPHQTGHGDAGTHGSPDDADGADGADGSGEIAYATTQAQYRDAAAPEPYSYEDDGYDDGGRV